MYVFSACIFILYSHYTAMDLRKRLWISQRIKELGKKKKDLAKVLGLPHTRVSDIISGNRSLKITEIENFADYMHMTINEVLDRFNSREINVMPNYDGLVTDEKAVIMLYRGLSEPGKQRFQQLAKDVETDEA